MLLRVSVSVFFLCMSVFVKAQLYEEAFHVTWNTLVPISDKEFTSKTSSAGVRIGFTRFLSDRFGFGIEGAYNSLDDYVPRQTYQFLGGAITTDVYNYLYYFTAMANVQYYFMQGNKFIPYASFGIGAAFSEYRIFYNVYEDTDSQQSLVIRPEVGTLFRFKEYSSWGLKSSLSYDFTSNRSDYFEVGNFSAIGFQIGAVFFTD